MPNRDLPRFADLRRAPRRLHLPGLPDIALALLIGAGAVILADAALSAALAIPTLAGPPPGCC